MPETAYDRPCVGGRRLAHHYGENVHILADPWGLSLLARLSHPDTDTRAVHPLLDAAFRHLLAAAVQELPTTQADLPTRMTAGEPRARNTGAILDDAHRAIVVDVARAGMIPAHIVQVGLMEVLQPHRVRVDHVYLQRVPDPVTGAVTGVAHSGSKIGGPVCGSTVFVPDPMAATGSSFAYVFDLYRNQPDGAPAKLVAMHLIVTPEYLARVAREAPDVTVYALRVDRGLSPEHVLAAAPGAHWADEVGLDDNSYIVPGAGGLGEVINNAFV